MQIKAEKIVWRLNTCELMCISSLFSNVLRILETMGRRNKRVALGQIWHYVLYTFSKTYTKNNALLPNTKITQ